MEVARIPLRDRHGEVVARALVDASDYPALALFRWHRTSEGYARRTIEGGRKVYMHRQLLGLTPRDPRFADHINRDRLDNRRSNLRIVTRAEQQQNLSKQRGRTSRYRGVYRTESGRWCAQVRHAGRTVVLGVYDDELLAARVAADYRREHFQNAVEDLPPLTEEERRPANVSARGGTSRYRGVVWVARAKKWMAYGAVRGKRHHLGYFTDEEEAAQVAAAWRAEHGL